MSFAPNIPTLLPHIYPTSYFYYLGVVFFLLEKKVRTHLAHSGLYVVFAVVYFTGAPHFLLGCGYALLAVLHIVELHLEYRDSGETSNSE